MRIDVAAGSPDDVPAEGCRAFNAPHVRRHGWTPIKPSVFRDGRTRPAGGVMAHCCAAWVHVLMFWPPEDLRGQGLGAHLDTFGFQARPFHEKQGCRRFGELPGRPPGGARYFMMRRFDGAAGETHVQA